MTITAQKILCSFLLFFAVLHLSAQQVRINEVAASNAIFFDEDGETPDWFELYNFGNDTISLADWTISDNANRPDKWTFPAVVMAPGDHLLVWASGKDRKTFGIPRTLITQGDEFRYLIPSQEVNPNWKSLGFDDADWSVGATSIGYGDGDDVTMIPQGTLSVYLRKKFSVADVASIRELVFDVDYDDAFVAYINGVEIARANIQGDPPAFDARTITDHEAGIYNGRQPDRVVISNPGDLLQPGENILCIQAHNRSTSSSDFTIIPFLSALYVAESSEGIDPPELLQLESRFLHTNFKISSAGETLSLYDPSGQLKDSLRAENLSSDVSLGIPPDGGNPLIYGTPTPGSPNTEPGYIGITNAMIEFSHPGGKTGPISLTLSGVSPSDVIRYTLDASIPDEHDLVYSGPIDIDQNTVVRARVFQPDFLPSATQSRAYLVDVSHDLPIISLVTEPHNFFDENYGIYVYGDTYEPDFPHFGANFWENWERPIHFSLYEADGSLGLAFNGGTKIFGGWSRGHDQRSFSIFARKQYGLGEINYPLFPDQPYENYQAIVLRNSGNDWLNTMVRDAALTSLMKGAGLDYQAYRPAVTYVNGEYWGFYNMREKVNEHFLASKYNLNPSDVDLLEGGGTLIHGDNQDYLDLMDYVRDNDLDSENNYQFVANQMDIENYIIYQIAQIYFDNTDWPGNNLKFWRPKDGKWRWILFDTDFGFGIWNLNNYNNNTLAFALEPEGPGWPNPPWATLLFRKLVENETFRHAFINRFADEMNSRFLPEQVRAHIDSLATGISSEIEAQYDRWERNPQGWINQVNNMKSFALSRQDPVKQHILNVFELPAYHPITIENEDPAKGYVLINRLTIKEQEWTGDYFEEVPIKVVAIPEPGYTFSHWSNGSISTNAELEINMTEALTLVPHFESIPMPEAEIVINEINYSPNNNYDTGDWVELYNPNNDPLNLSNWVFKDSDDSHSFIFPSGTFIPGDGYLILCRNIDKFRFLKPEIENIIGNFDFGLSSKEDMVRVYDAFGILRDSVHYLSEAPWPEGADGTGATIELTHPSLDNSLPQSWAILHPQGSPGDANFIDSDTTTVETSENITALKYFPNPFRNQMTLSFRVHQPTMVRALLHDQKGALIRSIINRELREGDYRVEPNLSGLSPGVYFLEFVEGEDFKRVLKWVKM